MEHPDITKMNRFGTLGLLSEEKEVIGRCEQCGEDILDGDNRYDVDGVMVHEDCFFDYANLNYFVRG